MRLLGCCFSGVAYVLLGSVSALAAVLVHGAWWGNLLVWAVVLVLLTALPRQWCGRPAFAVGWITVVALTLGARPEGDFLVSSSLLGYSFLATSLVLVVTAVVGVAGTLPQSSGAAPRHEAPHS